MLLSLRLYLVVASSSVTLCSSDFLQSTLDRIQRERLDTVLDYNHTDPNSEFNGEIIFDSDDNSLESVPQDNYELSLDSSLPDHGQQLQFSNHVPHEQQSQYSNEVQHEQQHSTHHQSSSNGGSDGEGQMYYYYFYPLNHYLQNIKQQHSHQAPTDEPMKDSDMMNMMMDSMMKNSMMMKDDNKVTPLFKAISWFIGTAMIFVLSILLMPRFRVKKAKVIYHDRQMKQNIIPIPPPALRKFHKDPCSRSFTN